ncbi:MAG TPA: N-acetylmuramoyl-L-alanine amidase [Candidatus Binatia bacterium]|nr:N-acetylmuramoyl-L-alanine amidase [Candidatus Binatia bacterium]
MATTSTKPGIDFNPALSPPAPHSWRHSPEWSLSGFSHSRNQPDSTPGRDALQALLAFSAMHQQIRRRRALAAPHEGFETAPAAEFEPQEQFVLDEVLQLVADRAIAITGADGLGIALAESGEIVLRASAGEIKPDVGARIQRDSAFSGACFRHAQVIRCDDTETDDRVNLYACRQLGARSMVAVPLCGRRRVIGLLEAFSIEPFGFNDSDVVSLELLAELVVGALKPEDEDRFAESAQAAETKLTAPELPAVPGAPAIAESLTPALAAPPAEPANTSSSVAEAPAPVAATPAEALETKVALEPVTAAETPTELFADSQLAPKSEHHPGIVLILVLIVLAALLGGGLWWKLKNAQLSSAMIHTETIHTETIQTEKNRAQTAAQADAKTEAPAPPSIPAPDVTGPQSGVAPGNSSDLDSPAAPESNSAPLDPSKMPRLTGIRHWSSADSSTVVLDLEDQVQYEAHRLSHPDRIYFDLHDTSLAPELAGKILEIGDSLLARVRVAQPTPGLTRVVLETKANANFSVSLEPNPYRLLVQVRKLGADPKAQVNLFPGDKAEKQALVIPPPTSEDLQLRARVPKMRIVVDAGHGGWDLGTVGRRGLLEKDLVLEVAQRLGKLLESRLGAEIILTRNGDNYIPLDERASIANQSQADLFVSVHANYSDLPSARGVETYYTNFFSSPAAKDLELAGNEKPAAPAVLSAVELHDRIEQSRRLAASVQRSLYGSLAPQNPGLRDRGVKEASYVVLTETAMPGILAEVSFVSSPTDEQKLRDDAYRERIAEALYRGIARYAANSRGVKMASAAK